MMTNNERTSCIFCQIADGKSDTEIKYQDEKFVVFLDKRPATSHHYLVIPRDHYKDIHGVTKDNISIITEMVSIGEKVLNQYRGNANSSRLGFHWPPFRTVTHLHLHVIAPEEEMGFISRGIFKKDSFWFVSPEVAIDRISKS